MDDGMRDFYLGVGREPCKCCLTCSNSLSADGEGGSMYLVCAIDEYKVVDEYGFCDQYN